MGYTDLQVIRSELEHIEGSRGCLLTSSVQCTDCRIKNWKMLTEGQLNFGKSLLSPSKLIGMNVQMPI